MGHEYKYTKRQKSLQSVNITERFKRSYGHGAQHLGLLRKLSPEPHWTQATWSLTLNFMQLPNIQAVFYLHTQKIKYKMLYVHYILSPFGKAKYTKLSRSISPNSSA